MRKQSATPLLHLAPCLDTGKGFHPGPCAALARTRVGKRQG